MLYVGIMATTQPFYIAGVADHEKFKDNAFGAMGMFIFSFMASTYGIYHHEKYGGFGTENDIVVEAYDPNLPFAHNIRSDGSQVEMAGGIATSDNFRFS